MVGYKFSHIVSIFFHIIPLRSFVSCGIIYIVVLFRAAIHYYTEGIPMETPQLKKKYGLLTAIAMVVGVVAGSGVFFKAETVLVATGGNVGTGVVAWLLVGLVMVICANTFSVLASRYERASGIVDFAEIEAGSVFSFFMGWFMATIYYPSLNAILAWVTAHYLCILFGITHLTGSMTMLFAAFFLVMLFGTNALAPITAGKLQVSTTVIKLLPLVCMAIFGILSGVDTGMLARNIFTSVPLENGSGLFAAAIAVAFAYEGWIVAISLNGELKNSKRNMPIALTIGTLVIVAIYVFYYIGLTGVVTTDTLMTSGHKAAALAFEKLFGHGMGTAVFVLVVISCIATCNGVSAANCRGLYALASRKHITPRFAELDPHCNMPLSSSIMGLMMSMLWLVYFYGSNITTPWFPQVFCFDVSELPVVTLYALYIPIFLQMMRREKELPTSQRFVLPALAILGCLFMVAACVVAHREKMLGYLTVFTVDMLFGALVMLRNRKAKPVRTPIAP